ncbi:hypothetical protein EV363DRAFT_1247962 [Boletus edulis]|nr:hypothetical protein EV363DRAFT_1247962 [Boletus edulis]
MEPKLPANIIPGIVNVPARDPQTQTVAESLLEEDRQKHHCFFNPQGFHNHLSHHLLAAYDLGAPATVLQAIYDTKCQIQKPIDGENDTPLEQVKITPDNFTKYVGDRRYYHAFLTFFTEQIIESGASETIESYVFSAAVNVDGVQMLARFMSGIYHPLIQTAYGVEFGSDAMIAQGLAQAAVHSNVVSDLVDFTAPDTPNDTSNTSIRDEKEKGKPLLHILRELYNSDALKPVAYDPDKDVGQYRVDTMKDGLPEELKKLCATWWSSASSESQALNLDVKVEELFWMNTLLLCATGKRGCKPRLDFVLMHTLNSTLFLPSLLKIIPSGPSKVKLLKSFLPVTMMYVLVRGRPRIDAGLVMSYTAAPRPPGLPSATPTPSAHAIGDPNQTYNPWLSISASVIHAPDAHTVKCIRALYYAAQHYGHKKARDLPGCFITLKEERGETLPGISELDGTVFVRAAGVVMDTLGWVTHGDNPGTWDFSGLGWDEAWRDNDQ